MGDRKVLVFPHVFLFGRIGKWRDRKPFCLVEKKNKRITNITYIYIYLLSCPYFIKYIYIYINSLKGEKNTITIPQKKNQS